MRHIHAVHAWVLHHHSKIVDHKVIAHHHRQLVAAHRYCIYHLHHKINIQVNYLTFILPWEPCLEFIYNAIVLSIPVVGADVVGVVTSDDRSHHLDLVGTPVAVELGIHGV